jgi:hypothetical protein
MKDLFLSKKYATIREIKDPDNSIEQRNELRIYKSSTEGFDFQIRTLKPIGEYGQGTPRKMIANVTLTIAEVESILAYMKGEQYQS